MKRLYRVSFGVPPNQQGKMWDLITQELEVAPNLVSGDLEFADEQSARSIVVRLHEAGYRSGLHLVTVYDPEELDQAKLLRLVPLEWYDDLSIWTTPPSTWFTEEGVRWRPENPACDLMYLDYPTVRGKELIGDPHSHEIVISRRVKELWESHQVSGVAYWPLSDACTEDRSVSPTVDFYLAQTTKTLPPLDPRVLVQPWKSPNGSPNFPIASLLYYTRERLSEWRDMNHLYLEELGARVVPILIVSQRLRQLLVSASIQGVDYEPVMIIGECENVEIFPKAWSWYPTREFPRIIPLEVAKREFPR